MNYALVKFLVVNRVNVFAIHFCIVILGFHPGFSREVTNFPYSKPGGLQKFYLHPRKDYLKIHLFTIP